MQFMESRNSISNLIFCLILVLIFFQSTQLFANNRFFIQKSDSIMTERNEYLDTNTPNNRRQWQFGVAIDTGPSYHVFSTTPFDMSYFTLKFNSQLNFIGQAGSASMMIDILLGDNIIRGKLGLRSENGAIEWLEDNEIAPSSGIYVLTRRLLNYRATNFVIGTGFKKKLIGSLYGEILGEASFVLDNKFFYRQDANVIWGQIQHDSPLPGLQGSIHGIAGITYDIPWQMNKELQLIIAPFVRYHYAFTSIHTVANWKISRISFGAEIRF